MLLVIECCVSSASRAQSPKAVWRWFHYSQRTKAGHRGFPACAVAFTEHGFLQAQVTAYHDLIQATINAWRGFVKIGGLPTIIFKSHFLCLLCLKTNIYACRQLLIT